MNPRAQAPIMRDGAALTILTALTLLFYAPLFTATRLAHHADAANLFLPGHVFSAGALWDGVWPLWNPYHYLGSPFHAGMQSALFYPLHWPIRLAFSTESTAVAALNATRLLHLLILGWGGYALLRKGYGARAEGALLAGLLLACGGFTWNHLPHINQIVSLSWCPWVILAARRLALGGGPRWMLALCGAMTLGLLAGHPQNLAIAQLFCALLLPVWLWSAGHSAREILGILGRFAAAGALALLLAAVQWMPTLELARQAWIIGEGPDYAAAIALPPAKLWEYFTPFLFGSDHGGRPPFTEGWMHAEFGMYFGILGLLAAGTGIVVLLRGRESSNAKRAEGAALLAIWLFAAVMALGKATPIFDAVLSFATPLQRFRVPARYMLMAHFALAIFAAYGASAALDGIRSRPGLLRQASRFGAAALLLLFAELWLSSKGAAFRHAPEFRGTPQLSPIWRALEEGGAVARPGTPLTGEPQRVFWMIRDDHYHDVSDGAHLIRAGQLNPNNNLIYGLEMTHGYGESLQPTLRYRDFLYTWHRSFFQARPDPDLLAMMNVQWIVTDIDAPLDVDGELVAVEPRPGMTPLSLYRMRGGSERIIERGRLPFPGAADFFDGAWRHSGTPIGGMNQQLLPWREQVGPPRIDTEEPGEDSRVACAMPIWNRMSFRIPAPSEVLYVSQAAYPGWRVRGDDGTDFGRVESHSAILQALPEALTAGEYRLTFEPGSFRWGVLLTALGCCATSLLFIVLSGYRRKQICLTTEKENAKR